MAYLFVRMARLLLWLTMLGGCIVAVLSGVMLLVGESSGYRQALRWAAVIGATVVAVTFVVDCPARRAELRMGPKRHELRVFK